MKSILFYTDNKFSMPEVFERLQIGLPIVSVSLKPLDFGTNIVLNLKPNYLTMCTQILTGLEAIQTKYVFFTEHDVLYHKSHFDFTPDRDDIFYYNTNVWRWDYPTSRVITYDRLISLSGMCCYRDLALEHYRKRLAKLKTIEMSGHEPQAVRKMGYEPGTKPTRKGGLTNETYEEWKSPYPNIDIRHKGTFTRNKTKLTDFKHLPTGWKESKIDLVAT